MEKRITLATVKSFIRKNSDSLYIDIKSEFDGMIDCVTQVNGGFAKIENDRLNCSENTLGINGAWFVGSSRDHFSAYNKDGFEGIRVSNCCGSFILAIPVQVN